ncbi:hypothetical protein JCGZ_09338 [Jatropha curcas]|uniref:Uncharacterized protein n=1 Tax=Jatropha curcas TaxID=180498 RepID=A0A067KK53_JATCU|nr:hypothetical protein JCGZ_09338 [Jatropha curcas]
MQEENVVPIEKALERQSRKRAREESSHEQSSRRWNVGAFIKAIHGSSASVLDSPVSKDFSELCILDWDFNYFDHIDENVFLDGMNSIFSL